MAAGAAAAGCRVDADFAGTAYACPDGRCPAGFVCSSGMCLENPGDSGVIDGSGPDAPGPDADLCTCEAERFADSCLAADLQVLTAVADPGGQRVCATTASNSNVFLGCPGVPLPAADAVFRFSANQNDTITAALVPTGFDGAVYLMSDCGTVCLGLANDQGLGGSETLVLSAPDTGDYFAVVDSATGVGCYELTVTVTP